MAGKILKIIKAKNYLPIKLFVPALFLVLVVALFITKTAMSIQPAFMAANHPVDKPFVINLNQSIRDIETANIKIIPKIDGKWQFNGGGWAKAS